MEDIDIDAVVRLLCRVTRGRVEELRENDPKSDEADELEELLGYVDPELIERRLAEEWWNS